MLDPRSSQLPEFHIPDATPFWLGGGEKSLPVSSQKFGDDKWDLRVTVPIGRSADPASIHWLKFPAQWRTELKLAAWLLINEGASGEFVLAHGLATTEFLSYFGNYKCVLEWRKLAEWAVLRRIASPSDLTEEDFDAFYHEALLSRKAGHSVTKVTLISISRLWDLTSASSRPMIRPPWYGTVELAGYLPQTPTSTENLVSVIPLDVIGRLYGWAERFVSDLSEDILAAKTERDRLLLAEGKQRTRGGNASSLIMSDWFEKVRRNDALVPHRDGRPATGFIAGTVGVSRTVVSNFMRRDYVKSYSETHKGRAELTLPSERTEMSRRFMPSILMDEVDGYWLLLGTAAAVCIAYMTGMRLGEILNLEVGCCTPHTSKEGAYRVKGLPSGKTSSALIDDEDPELTWDAIKPVFDAIRVLENMVQDGKLFNAFVHTQGRGRGADHQDGRPLLGKTMSDRLATLAAFVSAAEQGLPMETGVGEDLQFGMFRRTLAYYIARQPNGLISLAVQYNHMRTVTSEGYSTRRRDGFADLLDIETARAAADALAGVADVLENGGRVSGPAAARMIAASRSFDLKFPGRILTEREARRFMETSEFRVFPNPGMFLMCNFDASKALCLKVKADKAPVPRLDSCSSGCGNIVRTDSLMNDAYIKADRVEGLAADEDTAPFVAERLAAQAASLRGMADRHFRRTTVSGSDES